MRVAHPVWETLYVGNWRRSAFFALDRLRGSPYRRHLQDLSEFFRDPPGYVTVIEARLRRLLSHAARTTAAYAPYHGASDLRDFPVLTKRQIVERQREYLSTAFETARLPHLSTSGSYGVPFRYPLTWEKRYRQRAEIFYFNRWAGFEIGDRHVFAGATGQSKSRLNRFLLNQVWMDPTDLTPAGLSAQCDVLRDGATMAMVAQPSHAVHLARHSLSAGRSPDDYGLKGIVLAAETLDDHVRSQIEMAFGCPALSRYASREVSVVAMECRRERTFHLNPTSVVIEILALDRDEPAPDGSTGRVVVTDLFSHAMPLIRYDTGDLAAAGYECRCGVRGPVLASLAGRAVETIHDPTGEPVYPIAISNLLGEFHSIAQFQFVQRGANDYVLFLRVLPGYDNEQEIIRTLRSIIGTGANLGIEKVDEIPPLPSGKRASVVDARDTTARRRDAKR
jgi:phenylacetate-CoA ligase